MVENQLQGIKVDLSHSAMNSTAVLMRQVTPTPTSTSHHLPFFLPTPSRSFLLFPHYSPRPLLNPIPQTDDLLYGTAQVTC